MTKQELIKMMGNEDRADWALNLVLEMIKPEMVRTAIKVKRQAAEKHYAEREASGYYKAGDEALQSLPEDFNFWRATPEQKATYQIWEDRRREESSDRASVIFLHNMEAAANTPR